MLRQPKHLDKRVESPAAGGHCGSGGKTQLPEDGSLGGKAPSPWRQDGLPPDPSKVREPLGDFCNFSIKITYFYAYFS